MDAMRSKKETRFAMNTMIAHMVMGDMNNDQIKRACGKVFTLNQADEHSLHDTIEATRLMKQICEEPLLDEFGMLELTDEIL